MNRKKRILMVGEASYTCSGFGTYTNEVMQRLAKTNKYELAELASYGLINDPKDKDVNWKFYANAVRDDDPRVGAYRQKITNQWGEWRLDRVLLDFKPDIVWDIRDPWMLDWVKDSPFRKFFHWVIMPTVDSAPQQESWIDTFKGADGVFTYSDWSLNVLKKEGNGKIKLRCSAPPGTSLDIFKPAKIKEEQKFKMGLNPKMNIIGTIMRNQRRKLYPDLIDAFRIFIEKCNEQGLDELAQNTYLFIHTSYPDAGWNIPKLLKDSGVSQKVIFSYVCRACGRWFASPFQDALGTCLHCHNVGSAILPSVANGVDSSFLAEIMKCFDVYVQLSICEGFGMPQVEAASCGVPTMGMPYSATDDILKKSSGISVKIAKEYLELETQAFRMMPDNEDLANRFIDFFQLMKSKKQNHAVKSRQACEKFYNYDNTAKIWETYFDSVELNGLQGRWSETPPNIYTIPEKIPENLNNEEFITFIFNDVLREPELRYTLLGLKLTTDINLGASIEGQEIKPVKREDIFNAFRNRALSKIFAEQARCGLVQLPQEDYITYADMKARSLNVHQGDVI